VIFSPAAQAQVCMVNGQTVPDDCFTYNGCGNQTGTMVCTDSDGKPEGEWELQQGKHVGYEKQFHNKGGYTEQTVDEKGQPVGISKQFSATGNLLSETNYENGKEEGKAHTYYPSGHVKDAIWWEHGMHKFSVSYRDDGKITDLHCNLQHVMDEDKSPCGFDGKPSLVTITLLSNDTRTVSYLNGVLVKEIFLSGAGTPVTEEEHNQNNSAFKEYFPDGKVKHEFSRKQGRLDGMEIDYHSSGQVIRKTLWDNGEMRKEEVYFLNGQMESDAEWEKQGDRWVIAVKEFDDNGKLRTDGAYLEEEHKIPSSGISSPRWRYSWRIGEFHDYDPSGRLVSTLYYDDTNKLRERKDWDASGNLLRDDEIFDDGSRKSKIGTDSK
jgi:antitoxin component YwqK of YwqJK toxin-antitoxin module